MVYNPKECGPLLTEQYPRQSWPTHWWVFVVWETLEIASVGADVFSSHLCPKYSLKLATVIAAESQPSGISPHSPQLCRLLPFLTDKVRTGGGAFARTGLGPHHLPYCRE